jgi:hypothetical protein
VLAPIEAIEASPIFQDAADHLIPDPLTFSQWFSRADETRRKLAVGVRRYATAKEILGHAPQWEDLLDPTSGRLLSLAELQDESPGERMMRVNKARALINQRGRQRAQVARMGFVS